MKRVSSGGFTIVETMIVLGVSGVLFLSLAALVSGQQGKARFKTAVTDVTTQIQSQINEVATGYYPNLTNFTCSGAGGVVVVQPGGNEQGTNKQCTYLGRAMMYGVPGTDPQQYKIQTLVGLRKTALGREPTTIRETALRALAPGNTTTAAWPTWPDLSSTKTLHYGLELVWMESRNGGGPGIAERIAGFAIVASPNNQLTVNQNGSLESGTVVTSIIPIPHSNVGPGPGVTPREGVDLIVRSLGLPATSPSALIAEPTDGPVDLCFRSSTTNQSALVTIGLNNSTTSIESVVYNTVDCS